MGEVQEFQELSNIIAIRVAVPVGNKVNARCFLYKISYNVTLCNLFKLK
jgi:hypothetical protein